MILPIDKTISISNHIFGKVIRDNLSECTNFEIDLVKVKRGQFQNFQKSRG